MTVDLSRWRESATTLYNRAVAWLLRLAFAAPAQDDARDDITTETLIRRYQEGYPHAFDAIYDRYKDYVYRVALYVTRNADEAEDGVQETFLDVLKALPHYKIDGPARFETWLYRVTLNRCRMRMRKKQPDSATWDEIQERLEQAPSPDMKEPESQLIQREQTGKLWAAVNELPDMHRTVLLLRYQNELSYNEIAETLGVSVGTVKSRLYNAHSKLKTILSGLPVKSG
ncbi:MAG: sigma-70 family RNA polymerase sigma factor [Anaerolineae bacterium]|nr:sigma-70 family RNA polymerase sigma factor [Anaerolineae bacterium]